MLQDRRRVMVAGQQDVGERLVVAQQHVVARPELLDQVRLEQQRLGLGTRGDELHVRRLGDHPGDGVGMRHAARIGGHAVLQALGLADIEHLAGAIEHPVDARLVRQVLGELLDDFDAGLERAGRRLAEIERRFGGEGVLLVLELVLRKIVLAFATHGLHVGCRNGFVMSGAAAIQR